MLLEVDNYFYLHFSRRITGGKKVLIQWMDETRELCEV